MLWLTIPQTMFRRSLCAFAEQRVKDIIWLSAELDKDKRRSYISVDQKHGLGVFPKSLTRQALCERAARRVVALSPRIGQLWRTKWKRAPGVYVVHAHGDSIESPGSFEMLRVRDRHRLYMHQDALIAGEWSRVTSHWRCTHCQCVSFEESAVCFCSCGQGEMVHYDNEPDWTAYAVHACFK